MQEVLFDGLMRGLENVLTLRQKQHALTSTNLAHSETPGFKAKVIDFEKALDGAIERGDALALLRQHPKHLGPAGTDRARILEIEPNPWSSDGNSVVPERETARLQENALMYRAVAEGMTRRLSLLKYAATDGK